jgi:ribosomal protein S18 acetylase RimI-like enzyme
MCSDKDSSSAHACAPVDAPLAAAEVGDGRVRWLQAPLRPTLARQVAELTEASGIHDVDKRSAFVSAVAVVIDDAGKLAACAAFENPRHDPAWNFVPGDIIHYSMLAVAPEHRRQGLARTLTESAVRRARLQQLTLVAATARHSPATQLFAGWRSLGSVQGTVIWDCWMLPGPDHETPPGSNADVEARRNARSHGGLDLLNVEQVPPDDPAGLDFVVEAGRDPAAYLNTYLPRRPDRESAESWLEAVGENRFPSAKTLVHCRKA